MSEQVIGMHDVAGDVRDIVHDGCERSDDLSEQSKVRARSESSRAQTDAVHVQSQYVHVQTSSVQEQGIAAHALTDNARKQKWASRKQAAPLHSQVDKLRSALSEWFERHGRAHLLWRTAQTPYAVVVSEFMLQQTQVDRVTPLYAAFIAEFPDFDSLASASRADVVRLWKGLGYNSRAVRLHELARRVVSDYKGELPRDPEHLAALPGIGPYTLAAIRAFAFDEHAVAFDVNLRRVLHRVFFGIEYPPAAKDAEILAEGDKWLTTQSARMWNAALMDLGSSLCTARAPKCLLCPLQKECVAAPIDASQLADLAKLHARKRGPQESMRFENTKRFARGRIIDRLRELPAHRRISFIDLRADLHQHLGTREEAEVRRVVDDLLRDGLIEGDESGLCLRS